LISKTKSGIFSCQLWASDHHFVFSGVEAVDSTPQRHSPPSNTTQDTQTLDWKEPLQPQLLHPSDKNLMMAVATNEFVWHNVSSDYVKRIIS
jgi:hypothetical protein